MSHRLFIALLFATALPGPVSKCQAEMITFDVMVSQSTVIQGGQVDWQVFVTVSDSDANNFGIATAAVSLTDSAGDALNTGTIESAFANYSFNSGGTPSGASLIEITSSLFIQDNSKVVAADPGNVVGSSLGPTLLAIGSYQANTLGTHNLSSFAGSVNNYFTAMGQFNGAGTLDYTPTFNSTTFTVSAVPEPGSAGLAGLGVFLYATLSARRRKSSSKA